MNSVQFGKDENDGEQLDLDLNNKIRQLEKCIEVYQNTIDTDLQVIGEN